MAGLAGIERDEEVSSTEETEFLLSAPDETMVASGVVRRWDAPLIEGLPEEVSAGLAEGSGEGIVVGALPFRPDRPSFLFEPRELVRVAENPVPVARGTASRPPSGPLLWSADTAASRRGYEHCVGHALKLMHGGGSLAPELRKVVLARSVLLHTPEPIDASALVDRLRSDPAVTVFAVPLPSEGAGSRLLVGATPELLIDKSGSRVVSHPLAGSVRRSDDPTTDAEVAATLLRSEKDRLEHALVVEYIADLLAPYCSRLDVPAGPSLVSTRSMWHLGTRIAGELKDDSVSSLELLAQIHPTPAVCGFPAGRAAAVIADLESFDRGFYGGAVGWSDASGDGRWFLSIRCAEVTPDAVRLYAGAGIVHGSDPMREVAETSAKLSAMLTALGIEEEEEEEDIGGQEAAS